jgi:hypothetical protein
MFNEKPVSNDGLFLLVKLNFEKLVRDQEQLLCFCKE